MTRELLGYMAAGSSKHARLLQEARELHLAAEAVRGARRERGGVVSPMGTPKAHQLTLGGVPAGRRTAWRSAARRLGNSLVTVGRRLERMGAARD